LRLWATRRSTLSGYNDFSCKFDMEKIA